MKINDLVRLNRIVTEMQESLEKYGKYLGKRGKKGYFRALNDIRLYLNGTEARIKDEEITYLSKWIKVDNPSYSPFDPTPDPYMYYCPSCNILSYKSTKYCPHCGIRLLREDEKFV